MSKGANMKKFIVITTINNITEGINKFSKENKWSLLLVSDKKTPKIVSKESNIKVLDIIWQEKINYNFTKYCPYNHYSIKNIGYLYAIKKSASEILDTDDDNIPYENWYDNFNLTENKYDVVVSPKYANVYNLFTAKHIWPRGFPLDKIKNKEKIQFGRSQEKQVAIIQGLADEDPDVDAIYRMIDGEIVHFNKRDAVILNSSVYCPFNSQNTLWFKEAFVYLYLPVSVTFRFTDILRGYIAQRGIWELNRNLAFVSSSVYQKRNEHDLMKDFFSEIECYLNVKKVVSILDSLSLTGIPTNDIRTIYEELCRNGIVQEVELKALEAWIKDIDKSD